MSDDILVISQEGCGACDTVKEYFQWKNKSYRELVVEKDITAEQLWEEYAEAGDGTPMVYVNGKYIYDVIAYYESGLE